MTSGRGPGTSLGKTLGKTLGITLAVSIRHRFGGFSLDVAFESQRRLTALFGPSGAGKSSVLACIAGLLRPEDARIVIDGVTLIDTERGIAVPAHQRRIGVVFQDARLFPHLTVEQNLHYGRFFAPLAERHRDPGAIVALLGLGALLKRRPGTLSGGERQRVAIGRALLSAPRLLLMDEPLASLDAARKAEILPYIERLRDELNLPIVYVSHDRAEVRRLAETVVCIDGGRIVAHGADLSLPERQPERELAVLTATVIGRGEDGRVVVDTGAGQWHLELSDISIGERVTIRIEGATSGKEHR